jgi:drug/metabolite transporter (DMT)-like permease
LVFGDRLNFFQILGTAFLIAGGLLISIKIKKGPVELFKGFWSAVLAGTLLAAAFSSFDRLFEIDPSFVNVYIWTRFGLLLGALSLFLVPSWRRAIRNSFSGFEKPKEKNFISASMFVGVKILGGAASVILNYAIKLGEVTVVNAMVALEYAFVFLLGIFLSGIAPRIFQEKLTAKNLFQKTLAILAIAAGVFLASQ